MYPIFFSVSNDDKDFAEKVWTEFPDEWIYLFTKTGRDGAHLWDEIALQELPKARIFVVFWSSRYPKSGGCVREILQAAELCRAGHLQPVVLRLDDYPITWPKDWTEEKGPPADERKVFDALKMLLDRRTSDPSVSTERATRLLAQEAEPLLNEKVPLLDRSDLLSALKRGLVLDHLKRLPTIWLSGFNGTGREWLAKQFFATVSPNGRVVMLQIDETTLPRDVHLRLESEAFGADEQRWLEIRNQPDETEVSELVAAIERLSKGRDLLLLRHSRIVQEDVDLPEWVDEVAKLLSVGTAPKLAIVSQRPLLGDRLLAVEGSILPFRVPTVDETILAEWIWSLIAHFEPQANGNRWTEETADRLLSACGGNPGFLIALVRSASRMVDLNDIDAMVARNEARMAEDITAYARWAFGQLGDDQDAQKTLLFLNDVSPCHIDDLEIAVKPKETILRVIKRLVGLGLVEHDAGDLFRLVPLLANRLSRDLVRPELVSWVARAQAEFARTPIEVRPDDEAGHDYIRLESRLSAALLTGGDPAETGLAGFVSASHWFKAGIRLYHARRYKSAWKMLQKAWAERDRFRDASRREVDRYYALTAIRLGEFDRAETCITRLGSDIRTLPIKTFLEANLAEHRRDFGEAIRKYEEALGQNSGKDQRREHIWRPLIRCILVSRYPDYDKAERHALDYVRHKRTVFSLFSLARVYLHWWHKGAAQGKAVPDDIADLYADAIEDLERHPGSGAAPFELYAEEAEFTGDYGAALGHMDGAIAAAPDRFELRSERWQLMARSGDVATAARAVREMNQTRHENLFADVWPAYLPALAETHTRALIASGQPAQLVNNFAPELQVGGALGRIIARVQREARKPAE